MANMFDYSINAPDPTQSLAQGVQAGSMVRNAQIQSQQQELAQQQQQAYRQDLTTLYNNPNSTPRDFAAFTMKYPQARESTKQAFDLMNEDQQRQALDGASRSYAAILSGRPDIARDIMTKKLDALKAGKAPQPQIDAQQHWLDLLEKAPEQAKAIGGLYLSSIMGADKFTATFGGLGKEQRETEAAPIDLQKGRAEIANIRSQIIDRAARLGLDKDKSADEYDLKIQELKAKAPGVQLSGGAEKTQSEAVSTALAAQQDSDAAASLAEAFEKEAPAGGLRAWSAEKYKELTGRQDVVSDLRRSATSIINRGSLGMLPPGPASDKDIQIVRSGFPDANANAAQISRWLKSYANVQKAIALREEIKADWIGQVGSLSKAPGDIEVNGVQVPAGTTFLDYMKRAKGTAPDNSGTKPRYLDYGTR